MRVLRNKANYLKFWLRILAMVCPAGQPWHVNQECRVRSLKLTPRLILVLKLLTGQLALAVSRRFMAQRSSRPLSGLDPNSEDAVRTRVRIRSFALGVLRAPLLPKRQKLSRKCGEYQLLITLRNSGRKKARSTTLLRASSSRFTCFFPNQTKRVCWVALGALWFPRRGWKLCPYPAR